MNDNSGNSTMYTPVKPKKSSLNEYRSLGGGKPVPLPPPGGLVPPI
jgi:hypothetical protein